MAITCSHSPWKGRKLEDKLKVYYNKVFENSCGWPNDTTRQLQTRPEKTTLIIDRIVVKEEEEFYNRLADAVQTAFMKEKVFVTRLRFN
jgi:excinuclease ABC subunit A